MRRFLTILLLLIFLFGLTKVRSQNSATATLNVGVAGTAGLLSGCVVTGKNPTSAASVTGCANPWPPVGWNLAIADGADETTAPPNGVLLDSFGSHVCTTGSNNSLGFPIVAHAGTTHSYCNLMGGDGALLGIFVSLPNGYSQLYVSKWEYTDPDALYPNSDYIFIQILGQSNCVVGAQAQQGSLTPASSVNANYFPMYAKRGTPSDGTICNDNFWYQGPDISPNPPINAGSWVQWEALYIPNTTFTSNNWVPGTTNPPPNCTSTTQDGCGNGTFKMWRNGALVLDVENANLNSGFLTQMTNSASAQVGGFDTSFSSTGAIRCTTWSMTGGGTCPGTQPGTGAPKPHYRYVDDITVLYK